MTSRRQHIVCFLLVGLAGLASASPLWAQEAPAKDAADAPAKDIEKQWRNLLHFIRIAQEEMAQSTAKAILASGVKPQDLYLLSVKEPGLQRTLARGSKLKGMKELVERLRKMIDLGYQADRSSPEQIAEAIVKLGAHERAARIREDWLRKHSGEYAMPQLIQALVDQKTTSMQRERIVSLLPKMGRQCVRAMSVALQAKDAKLVEVLATSLGRIGYPHASARLREALGRDDLLPRTKKIIASALAVCGGRATVDRRPADLFYDLALKYYYRKESIRPDQRHDKANVWYWRNKRLEYQPVPRAIFCNIYAMRSARLALQHDPKLSSAVSLWVSAFFKREVDLPAGAKDPIAPKERARYFALASSPQYLQDVLARAIRDWDTAVALRVIRELARTAGAETLASPQVEGGVAPLAVALSYPSRQVRLLAALSLANALPRTPFEGSRRVIAVLKDALRLTGKKTVALIVADNKLRNKLKDAIRGAGYELIDEPDAAKALGAARGGRGLDLVVVGDKPSPARVLRTVRGIPSFKIVPALIVSDSTVAAEIAESDKLSATVSPSAAPETIVKAMNDASSLGGTEPVTDARAAQWAVEAAKSIRLLGLTGNRVYDVNVALESLVAALGDERGDVQIAAARALAVMRLAKAQGGIVALANNGAADEKVRVAAYKALSESARRFGRLVSIDSAKGILPVVAGDGSQELREAAAEALGAMGLASQDIKSLIINTAGND